MSKTGFPETLNIQHRNDIIHIYILCIYAQILDMNECMILQIYIYICILSYYTSDDFNIEICCNPQWLGLNALCFDIHRSLFSFLSSNQWQLNAVDGKTMCTMPFFARDHVTLVSATRGWQVLSAGSQKPLGMCVWSSEPSVLWWALVGRLF